MSSIFSAECLGSKGGIRLVAGWLGEYAAVCRSPGWRGLILVIADKVFYRGVISGMEREDGKG